MLPPAGSSTKLLQAIRTVEPLPASLFWLLSFSWSRTEVRLSHVQCSSWSSGSPWSSTCQPCRHDHVSCWRFLSLAASSMMRTKKEDMPLTPCGVSLTRKFWRVSWQALPQQRWPTMRYVGGAPHEQRSRCTEKLPSKHFKMDSYICWPTQRLGPRFSHNMRTDFEGAEEQTDSPKPFLDINFSVQCLLCTFGAFGCVMILLWHGHLVCLSFSLTSLMCLSPMSRMLPA